jgi:hypothetical protein
MADERARQRPPQRGWITIIVDVEGMRTEEEFLRALCRKLEEAGDYAQSAFNHLKQRVKQLLADGWEGNPLHAIGKLDPRQFSEALIAALNAQTPKTLILIDEIALFVAERLAQDPESAKAFLYHLRRLRQAYPRVQWLLTGSVGLDSAAIRELLDSRAARSNLAWLDLLTNQVAEATASRGELADLPETGLALLDAGIEIASDNFGAATAHLDRALGAGLESEGWNFLDDLLRFFRLAFARGYGEKLIAHFEAAGHAERLAPVYAALVALVRGERHLLNFNPEARGPATKIYQSLVRPLRRADEGASQPGKTKRGRPRRPRSP